MSPDSVSYLAAARNLANGRGLLDFDGSVFAHWPPGFPVVLAAFELVGISGDGASRLVNAVALAAVVVLSYVLLRRHVSSPGLVLFGTAVVAVFPALLRTADMVWSEPMFSVLVLGFVLVLERACERRRLSLYALAGLLACCSHARSLPGFRADPCRDHVDLRGSAELGWSRKLRTAAWFCVWGLIGPALWAVRNVAQSEPPLGQQPSGGRTVLEAAGDLLVGIGRLAVPQGAPTAATLMVGLVVVAMLAVAFVIALRDPAARALMPVLLVAGAALGFTLVVG